MLASRPGRPRPSEAKAARARPAPPAASSCSRLWRWSSRGGAAEKASLALVLQRLLELLARRLAAILDAFDLVDRFLVLRDAGIVALVEEVDELEIAVDVLL